MKKILTLKKFMIRMLILVMLFISKEGFTQPDYSFSGGTVTSGTALTVGAVYQFNAVRPGVDATLTITAMSPEWDLRSSMVLQVILRPFSRRSQQPHGPMDMWK